MSKVKFAHYEAFDMARKQVAKEMENFRRIMRGEKPLPIDKEISLAYMEYDNFSAGYRE